jgi:hypothetical protein
MLEGTNVSEKPTTSSFEEEKKLASPKCCHVFIKLYSVWPYHDPGGYWPATHRGGPGLVPE